MQSQQRSNSQESPAHEVFLTLQNKIPSPKYHYIINILSNHWSKLDKTTVRLDRKKKKNT